MRKLFRGNQPAAGVLLAECLNWSLFELVGSSTGGWRSLKLVSSESRGKANFWLAHNGERFAAGKDDKVLADHYPAVRDWVESVLKASHD